MTHRLSIVAAASLALLPLVQPSQAQNAPAGSPGSFPRGDTGHSGYTPDTLPTPVSLLWRHTTAAAHANATSPAYADGVVYFGSGAHFYAVKSADGSLLWQFPASGDATAGFAATATVTNGSVYVGCDNDQLYKLDAKTGAQTWARKVGGAIRSSPIVDSGLVYFGSADRSAYALSADTGQIIWTQPTTGAITASPTLYNGAVVFASSDNSLYAYNPTTGRVAWSEPLPSDPSTSPPVSDGSQLYVGSGQTLYALQGRGGLRWSKSLGSELSAPATVGGGTVYAITQDRVVYALAGGSVADRNRIRWSRRLDYPSYAPPLLAGGVLLVPTQHGILYGLDAQTGALKWQYVIQPAATASQPKYAFTDIASAPVWANKTLYVLSDDGTLSAFRSEAVDKVGPQASNLTPAPGLAVAGVRIPYGATLVDEGSGIDPSSVSLQVDQALVTLAKYDPSKNGVAVDFSKDTHGDAYRPLADGTHQATLKAKDWHGNELTKTWAFVVDNSLDPPNIPAPGTLIDPSQDTPPAGGPLAPPTSTGGGAGPPIPRNPNGGRDPDGGVNGGPPPPPPIDGGGGAPAPPGGGGGGGKPPTPPGGGGGGGGGTPPPPTPPGGGGGGAPPPPAPPV